MGQPAGGPAGVRRIGVVGAGILGMTSARALLQRDPRLRVTVLEKEPAVARHQTAHNSGVVHAGVYYPPGSLKARLCTKGVGLLRDYCRAQGLAYDECGKLVVAVDHSEVPALRELHRRGRRNGVPGLALLEGSRLRAVEPHVAGVAALHSPRTAVTDFAAVAGAVAAEIGQLGAEVVLSAEVVALRQRVGRVEVDTRAGEFAFDRLVVCAGLHADRVAALSGDDPNPRIVPFRGDYFRLRDSRRDLVRGLVYPVPDPAYPFLGIHVTRTVDGQVLLGPNAALAFAREGYHLRDVVVADVVDTLGWPGFRRLARRHWRVGAAELLRSASRRAFVRQAQRYVPELRVADVVRGPSGVRAQALDVTGALVDDFRISRRGHVVNVRNAPSPAATSSFAIAEHIADQVLAGSAR